MSNFTEESTSMILKPVLAEYHAGLSRYWFSPVTNSPWDHCNILLNSKPWPVIKSSLITISQILFGHKENVISWVPRENETWSKNYWPGKQKWQNSLASLLVISTKEHWIKQALTNATVWMSTTMVFLSKRLELNAWIYEIIKNMFKTINKYCFYSENSFFTSTNYRPQASVHFSTL